MQKLKPKLFFSSIVSSLLHMLPNECHSVNLEYKIIRCPRFAAGPYGFAAWASRQTEGLVNKKGHLLVTFFIE